MSRPLPRCLHCGEPLAYAPRSVAQWSGIVGVPSVGVHLWEDGSCTSDDLWLRIVATFGTDGDPLPLLREAALRGRDRVISADTYQRRRIWRSGLRDGGRRRW
jgi:hypothetical protein